MEGHYAEIQSYDELPGGPGCLTNLFLDSELKARQHAAGTGRQVFWVRGEGVALWWQPMRRQADGVLS